MLCIKCKKIIPDNQLRCSYCHTKVQSVCPVCGQVNPITSEYCKRCGLQLLKHCKKCNSINLPSAKICRKCSYPFVKDKAEIAITDLSKMQKNPETPVSLDIPNTKIYTGISKELMALQVGDDKISEGLKKEKLAADKKPLINSKIVVSEEKVVKNIEKFTQKSPIQNVQPPKKNTNNKSEDVLKPEFSADMQAPKILPEETDTNSYEPKEYDQIKAKNHIINTLKQPEKLIIGLSAPEGYGKSTVLRYLFNDLLKQNYIWLWGECSANSQISPFGIFQEIVLTFFNMPNFSNMSNDFIRQARRMLSESLPFFNADEISNLFNFLYPSMTAKYEDILTNKDVTFELLEKLICELSKKSKLIIIIDDFDMIDGASYEFLSYFVDNGHLGDNIKLIISYKDSRITQGYFYSEKLLQNQYEDVKLSKLSPRDADNLIKMFLKGSNPLPKPVFEKIYYLSQGNSAYIEQMIVLLNENRAFYKESGKIRYNQNPIALNLPKNLYEILVLRLNHLQRKYPLAFKTLCTAAIMGNKFNVKLLGIIMKIDPQQFQNTIKMLSTFAYISQFNNNIYEFKNTLLWRFVYEKAKQSKDFVLLNEKIFEIGFKRSI